MLQGKIKATREPLTSISQLRCKTGIAWVGVASYAAALVSHAEVPQGGEESPQPSSINSSSEPVP